MSYFTIDTIVPTPSELETREGWTPIDETVSIVPSDGTTVPGAAERLVDLFDQEVGLRLSVRASEESPDGADIVIQFDDGIGTSAESYTIDVNEERITVSAASGAGLEYAGRSLVGLLVRRDGEWCVPHCSIQDGPAFEWRGFMVDPARGYIPLDRLKRLVDGAARAKLNRFHLHLLDAESCTIEFETYPELTDPLPDEFHDDSRLSKARRDDVPAYTRAEIEELASYANERNVELVPELDFPGHAERVLAVQPRLRCDVPDGEPSYWTVCAGAEATYEFIEDLVVELVDLFPFEVVHVGGDEFEFDYSWSDCERCRERMNNEGLEGTDELFEYFLRRVHGILDDHGRRMMIWNDGLDVSRPPEIPRDILVQFWTIRDVVDEGAEEFVDRLGDAPGQSMARFLEEGFEVVNSFNKVTYINKFTHEGMLRSWTPADLPTAPDEHSDRVLGGEMAAWHGWRDEPWRAYYERALPSALPLFGDRVWSGTPIHDRTEFAHGVARHALGPGITRNVSLYEDLGGILLPIEADTYPEKAHVKTSLAGRSIEEAVESYDAAIDQLETLDDEGVVPYPDTVEAYVDCLQWLIGMTDYLGRGVVGRPP